MSRKIQRHDRPPPDPAFAELDAMVERADEEFRAVVEMVEPAHRARFLAIVEHTDAYCMNHLEPLHREYETLCHVMAATLCHDGSPVVEGKAKAEGWAAAIVATLGFVNFLRDPSFPPVKTMEEVAAGFGVSASGMHAKSSRIREMLDLMQFEPTWTLPSLLDRNPLAWLLPTKSGLVVDIRTRPRAEQVMAFNAGLIPYVPADRARPDGAADEDQAGEGEATAGDVRRAEPPAPVGPTLFDPQPGGPLVEPKPERSPDVIGRIGPGAAKGRR